jgi:hypothetical protein
MIRTLGKPVGNTNLRVYLTGSHGDARLLAGGNDFLETELAVTEDSDKSNKHDDLWLLPIPIVLPTQANSLSCQLRSLSVGVERVLRRLKPNVGEARFSIFRESPFFSEVHAAIGAADRTCLARERCH